MRQRDHADEGEDSLPHAEGGGLPSPIEWAMRRHEGEEGDERRKRGDEEERRMKKRGE